MGTEQKRKDGKGCALINPQHSYCYNITVVKHRPHNSASRADGIPLRMARIAFNRPSIACRGRAVGDKSPG